MSTPTPVTNTVRKGTVSNTYTDASGNWHAEVEAADGNCSTEVFGCPLRTIYNRATKAIAARRETNTAQVKVEFLGLRRRANGTFYALFRERSNS